MPLQTWWLGALTSLKSHPFPASLAAFAHIGCVFRVIVSTDFTAS
jgi:hypothetical protein